MSPWWILPVVLYIAGWEMFVVNNPDARLVPRLCMFLLAPLLIPMSFLLVLRDWYDDFKHKDDGGGT
jgi:hypothetical protein